MNARPRTRYQVVDPPAFPPAQLGTGGRPRQHAGIKQGNRGKPTRRQNCRRRPEPRGNRPESSPPAAHSNPPAPLRPYQSVELDQAPATGFEIHIGRGHPGNVERLWHLASPIIEKNAAGVYHGQFSEEETTRTGGPSPADRKVSENAAAVKEITIVMPG